MTCLLAFQERLHLYLFNQWCRCTRFPCKKAGNEYDNKSEMLVCLNFGCWKPIYNNNNTSKLKNGEVYWKNIAYRSTIGFY